MAVTEAFEVNFDGLVGPTHNYAGLSFGNVASMENQARFSNPREAAFQGLAKMKALADLGLRQAVLPPRERPNVAALRRLGFQGSDAEVLARAAKEAPAALAICASASSMWAANAATVVPSADSADGRAHFVPANLNDRAHRALESAETAGIFRAIFRDPARFAHHEPLPSTPAFGDEGAANHTRLALEHGSPGVHFFVHGRAGGGEAAAPARFPARQTREACEALARVHGLAPGSVVHGLQNPAAIDAGAFHNDVVSVGNLDAFFYHERAFADEAGVTKALREAFRAATGGELVLIRVPEARVTLADAVRSYVFNSQLIKVPGKARGGKHRMALVAPSECQETPAVRDFLKELVADDRQPIAEVKSFDLRQSMRNGGGPACLRLRVVLTEAEIAATAPGVFLTPGLHGRLVAWVGKHYRDRLSPADLADPRLLDESRAALDELTGLLGLGSIYPFQAASGK